MGVAGRISELGRDRLFELLGENVLQYLGLLVHAVPGHAEALDQVQLEQPVVADHLEGDPSALVGQ